MLDLEKIAELAYEDEMDKLAALSLDDVRRLSDTLSMKNIQRAGDVVNGIIGRNKFERAARATTQSLGRGVDNVRDASILAGGLIGSGATATAGAIGRAAGATGRAGSRAAGAGKAGLGALGDSYSNLGKLLSGAKKGKGFGRGITKKRHKKYLMGLAGNSKAALGASAAGLGGAGLGINALLD